MFPEDILTLLMTVVIVLAGSGIWLTYRFTGLKERREIREHYTRLLCEKLDVIKTALAMGRSDEDIAALDARLEQLIGAEKMLETLKHPKGSSLKQGEMLDGDNDLETELLRHGRKRQIQE
jgi:hypothetical protein